MNPAITAFRTTGLEVLDLRSHSDFLARNLHPRNSFVHLEGMQRLARAFVHDPKTILQELADAAVDLCGADSAGISIVREDATEDNYFHWVATAGQYSSFLDAALPQYPSACSLCLERGRPQLFRVSQPFFDLLGIDAPLVTDGILIPWQAGPVKGTIFIMAHGRHQAFDQSDLRMMEVLADFASMGMRQQSQQALLMEQAGASAAIAMANDLAHRINNPLQSLSNLIYLASKGHHGVGAEALAADLAADLKRLSVLVGKLLEVPLQGSLHQTAAAGAIADFAMVSSSPELSS